MVVWDSPFMECVSLSYKFWPLKTNLTNHFCDLSAAKKIFWQIHVVFLKIMGEWKREGMYSRMIESKGDPWNRPYFPPPKFHACLILHYFTEKLVVRLRWNLIVRKPGDMIIRGIKLSGSELIPLNFIPPFFPALSYVIHNKAAWVADSFKKLLRNHTIFMAQ